MPGDTYDLDVCAACGHPIAAHAGGEKCARGGCPCPRFTPGRGDPALPGREPRNAGSVEAMVASRRQEVERQLRDLAEKVNAAGAERLAERDRLWCRALVASGIPTETMDAVLRKFEELRG